MNKDILHNCIAVVEHLKNNDSYEFLKRYFEEKKKIVLQELIDNAQMLEIEDIVSAKAKLMIYDELTSFDILLKNELQLEYSNKS